MERIFGILITGTAFTFFNIFQTMIFLRTTYKEVKFYDYYML
jgi:hypothetical protein